MTTLNLLIVGPRYLSALGRSIRSANLSGVDKIYLDDRRKLYVDANMKELRRFSRGAVDFQKVILLENVEKFLLENPKNHRKISTVVDQNATKLYDFQYLENDLLIFGDERKGLEKSVIDHSDELVTIPQAGNHVQCHTLCSAVSVLLYEKMRQDYFKSKTLTS